MRLLSYIPAPGDWGRRFRLYGIMIALGVLAALELARRRWKARGGDPDDISAIALWAVPAGLIGARLYHVITDNELYRGHWLDAFAIWNGGLGIPGGIALGLLVGVIVARKRGMRLAPGLDIVAPALPLAQAIGRMGNYFNQELFGRPTDLPWGLQVDPGYRPHDLVSFTYFQPTFLYEMLWNLALCGFLIWLDRKRVIRPGRLFALYIFGYFLGRLWVESLRSDFANTILGLRVNTWMSLLAMAAMVLVFVIGGVRRRPGDSDEPYVDGHRFDDEVATDVGADESDEAATGADAGEPVGLRSGPTKKKIEAKTAEDQYVAGDDATPDP